MIAEIAGAVAIVAAGCYQLAATHPVHVRAWRIKNSWWLEGGEPKPGRFLVPSEVTLDDFTGPAKAERQQQRNIFRDSDYHLYFMHGTWSRYPWSESLSEAYRRVRERQLNPWSRPHLRFAARRDWISLDEFNAMYMAIGSRKTADERLQASQNRSRPPLSPPCVGRR